LEKIILDHYLINENISIREAIQHMDKFQVRIGVCKSNKKDKVVGVFTEGDFRKAVYKGIDLNKKIFKILNKKFFYVNSRRETKKILNIFEKSLVTCIPVIKNRVLVDIIFREEILSQKRSINKKIPIVIMAGGKGKRLEPFTNILPKPLFPLGGEPIIIKIIKQFQDWGFEKFVLSIYEKSKIIKAYLKSYSDINLKFIEEERQMGTAGSLKLMKNFLKGTFIISNCDILIKTNFDEILKFHREKKNDFTIVGSMRHYKIPYGVCLLNGMGKLKQIIEKPSNDYLVNTGVYVAEKNIINLLSSKNYFDTDELITLLIKKKFKVGVFPISSDSWLDYGQWSEINKSLKF
jgi:dTDP-glucose pyrophosphorylase